MKGVKGIQYDNAAQRKTYVGYVYKAGTDTIKERVLNRLDEKYSLLHKEGKIHIHDLEAYGQTYNCLQMDILQGFPYERFMKYSDNRKINEIFNHFRDLIVKLGNEQSGGIGFPNFDEDVAFLFNRLNIAESQENLQVLKDSIESFIDWINCARERCGQVTYYVSLNLGLSTKIIGRLTAGWVIEYFKNSPIEIIKPNIIFKVKKGINYDEIDKNYDLFCLALESTCKKMIPTYLLFDSKTNEKYDPWKVAIMGCRTKVADNLFGGPCSIGRGNIAYISINLPRIALEVDRDHPNRDVYYKCCIFKDKWTEIATLVKEILMDRYNRLCELEPADFPCNYKFNLWIEDFKTVDSLEDVFKNGTLSIGFIGLSEAMEIISGERYYKSELIYSHAIDIIEHMRKVVDSFKAEHQLNFNLLASSGEFISGRFPEIDKQYFTHEVISKDFYTNSFHVNVDSDLHPIEKIIIEGPFHAYANGGCISYVEFSSAPLNNTEAVSEIIQTGIDNGVNYLGINFPLDKCRNCGCVGTFDDCFCCGSKDVLRIRRVSGYLEELEFFTTGKKAEVAFRRPNF